MSCHVIVNKVGGQEEERCGTLASMASAVRWFLGYGVHVHMYKRWAAMVARRWSHRRDFLGRERDIYLF
jgi:hypothetical protein